MNIEQLAIKNLEAQVEIYTKMVANYDRLLSELQTECYLAHKSFVSGQVMPDTLENMSNDILRATVHINDLAIKINDGKNWLKQLQP